MESLDFLSCILQYQIEQMTSKVISSFAAQHQETTIPTIIWRPAKNNVVVSQIASIVLAFSNINCALLDVGITHSYLD
jgi:ABC-type spermidine/putrescine transport system permease subunit II